MQILARALISVRNSSAGQTVYISVLLSKQVTCWEIYHIWTLTETIYFKVKDCEPGPMLCAITNNFFYLPLAAEITYVKLTFWQSGWAPRTYCKVQYPFKRTCYVYVALSFINLALYNKLAEADRRNVDCKAKLRLILPSQCTATSTGSKTSSLIKPHQWWETVVVSETFVSFIDLTFLTVQEDFIQLVSP